ncbi:hypothetical protein BH24ACT26_BH24ACT26_22460 [soil metagenome]
MSQGPGDPDDAEGTDRAQVPRAGSRKRYVSEAPVPAEETPDPREKDPGTTREPSRRDVRRDVDPDTGQVADPDPGPGRPRPPKEPPRH